MCRWDKFFDEKIKIIAKEKNIIDIGSGFKFQKEMAKYKELFKNANFRALDKEPSYQPDIVADIIHLPLENASIDAVICKAVLQHVSEPQQAIREIYRILKIGGKCLAYVPFLYPYHAKEGVYQDYYRFTDDGVRYLFKDFTHIEISPIRGNLETVFNLTPLRKITIFLPIIRFLDRFFSNKQVSGYNVYVIK